MTVLLYYPTNISFEVVYDGYINIYFETIAGLLNNLSSYHIKVDGSIFISEFINVTDEMDVIVDIQIHTAETAPISRKLHITVQGWHCWCLII